MCEQCLEMLMRYDSEAMKGVSGRRSFIGSLTMADKMTAKRGAGVKEKNMETRARKAAPRSAEEWAARAAAARTEPLPVQRHQATMQATTPSQRIFAVVMEEKIFGQTDKAAVFWTKVTGGVNSFLAEVNMLLPLVGSVVATLKARAPAGAPATHLERIGNITVKTVTTRGPPLFLRSTSDGKSEWAPVSVEWGGPKEIQVNAHQFGPLSVVSSWRRAFFARESPWKAGTGAVEGELPVKGRLTKVAIRRGEACPYCIRDGRKLQHWGCVACFLDPESRRALGVLVLMNTHLKSLVRLGSKAAETAEARAGPEWRVN